MSEKMMMKRSKNWKWLGLIALTFLLVFALRLPAIAQTPRSYNELTFPTLREIEIPKYERYQLNNGMVVYLMEDHQLPLVSGSAIIRTGSRLEPADKVGLADITGTLIRTGGTQQHSPQELNELLEQRAATVETSIGMSSGGASFNSLKEDLEPVLELFAEILRYPTFDPQQFELVKTQQKGAIARRNDEPDDIASREFRKLIYGENSPYSRVPEYTTLKNISREDVIEFYQTYFRPDQIILGLVGDFDSQKMKGLIEENFGNWKNTPPQPKIALPKVDEMINKGVFLVDQSQLTQSNILLGHLGGKLNDPDYPALSVLNGVLNGFGGRLFNDLRSRQGLAYSVYGYWQANYDYPGLFIAGGQTRSEATVPFIKSLVSEIQQVATTPVSETELAKAKETILNSFVFKFENPSQTLSRLMTYEYYDYPKDFIFEYQKAVKNTTVKDIQRVAKKHLNPDEVVTLVVGNNTEIKPSLTSLKTPIKTVDIAIPKPQG